MTVVYVDKLVVHVKLAAEPCRSTAVEVPQALRDMTCRAPSSWKLLPQRFLNDFWLSVQHIRGGQSWAGEPKWEHVGNEFQKHS